MNDDLEPVRVAYGDANGVYDPTTSLVKLSVDGEAFTLAIDAVMDNPKLLANFHQDAAYILGWLASHVTHQRQVLVWIATGVLNVNESLLQKH